MHHACHAWTRGERNVSTGCSAKLAAATVVAAKCQCHNRLTVHQMSLHAPISSGMCLARFQLVSLCLHLFTSCHVAKNCCHFTPAASDHLPNSLFGSSRLLLHWQLIPSAARMRFADVRLGIQALWIVHFSMRFRPLF